MSVFSLDWYFISLLIFVGLYGMLVSRNILRQLIGLEIVSKAAMLAVISAGALSSNLILAQALIITMIVVEVVVVAAGLALLVKAHRLSGSADIWKLDSLKG
ncbi:MAG TPA: NADH-quinone oxidoreductase subunit K [Elusimicrobiales bacterium]|nr:NADH-quinone oxidoreductase subunit K [Elusimicrobiales bacterium]